jgi:hypothetical protein
VFVIWSIELMVMPFEKVALTGVVAAPPTLAPGACCPHRHIDQIGTPKCGR